MTTVWERTDVFERLIYAEVVNSEAVMHAAAEPTAADLVDLGVLTVKD
jgi:hypothetical protein